jgi:hypothetical protein
MPWVMVAFALGMTLLRLPEAREERVNRDFQQRLYFLRLRSGSLKAAPLRPGPDRVAPDAGARRGTARFLETRSPPWA